jgi:hypothetical protein
MRAVQLFVFVITLPHAMSPLASARGRATASVIWTLGAGDCPKIARSATGKVRATGRDVFGAGLACATLVAIIRPNNTLAVFMSASCEPRRGTERTVNRAVIGE